MSLALKTTRASGRNVGESCFPLSWSLENPLFPSKRKAINKFSILVVIIIIISNTISHSISICIFKMYLLLCISYTTDYCMYCLKFAACHSCVIQNIFLHSRNRNLYRMECEYYHLRNATVVVIMINVES